MWFADKIINEYPYPIAKQSWRFNQAPDLATQFRHLDFLIQMTVQYIALIAVSNYIRDGLQIKAIQNQLEQLAKPTLDVWAGLLDGIVTHYETNNRTFVVPELINAYGSSFTENSALLAAQRFFIKEKSIDARLALEQPQKTIGGFLSDLLTYRNDTWVRWHGPVGESVTREHLAVLQPAVAEILEKLSFLSFYPLGYVAGVEMRETNIRYQLQTFMGYEEVPTSTYVEDIPDRSYFDPYQVYLSNPRGFPMLGLHPLLVVFDQGLYILGQNDLNKRILYISCGTGETYEPERQGYLLDELLPDIKPPPTNNTFANYAGTGSVGAA